MKQGPTDLKTGGQRLIVKDVGEDGSFEGYGSVFGVKDAYREIVVPGAFKKSLAEHKSAGTLPAMLWQHRPDKPIGAYTDVEEDKKGLFVRGQLSLETQAGKEAYVLLKAGALNGLSIGYELVKSEYDSEKRERTLTEIDLWEVSLVTFPANGKARIDNVKGNFADMDRFADVERHLREAYGVSQSEATAIVAKCKELDRKHREDAKAKSDITSSAKRVLDLLKS